ncbi:MAG: hypothetical protein RSA22_13590, partial [Acinetobacter sp.]
EIMAVSEQTPYIEYVGNGVTDTFPLGFDCDKKEYLIVSVDDVEPSAESWVLLAGSIVFNTAPINNQKITIQRNTPFSRSTDYQSYNNSFRPSPVNKDFDLVWWKLQELGVLDWILGKRIDELKIYSDAKNTELQDYLMEQIRQQGVALDQLDEYYNDFLDRLNQVLVSKGWDASFVIDGDKNQKQINDELKSKISKYPTILDFFTQSEKNQFDINPTMDLTAIIKRAFATGVKKLNFLDLQMHITLATNGSDTLASFTNGDIELYGNGAAFIDDTTHLMNGSVVALFTLNDNVNSFKSNINYIGKPVSLATEIGYRGATYVYSKGQNKNISLDLYIENIRYGILAGSYSTPSLGGHKGIRGKLRCKNVGYPIATYLADDIEMEITGEGFHRVHYIAGCNHARFRTQVKNYYIAPIPHFYTDALVSTSVSKGCTDCKTEAIDLGSTSYVTNGYLCGISLSRVDNGIKYDGIYFDGYIKGTDTQAQKLGLFTIASSVRSVQPSYPTNWNNTIELNNISIKGIIDRKQQTVEEHGFSDLYLSCVDDTSIAGERHFPKISNLNIDVDYFAGSGNKPRGSWWFLDGLQDIANVRLNAKNSGVNVIRSNPNSLIKFKDSSIVGVDGNNSASLNSKMEFINSFISDAAQLPTVNKRFVNTPIAGVYPQGTQITTTSNTLTLSGASVSWVNALPNNALILGVSFVITENITGSTGLLIGVTGTPNKYYSSAAVTAGSGLSNANSQTGSLPHNQVGTGSIVVVARDSGGGTSATFTGGKVKVVLNYIELPIPS